VNVSGARARARAGAVEPLGPARVRAIDRLFALYAVVSGLALAGPARPAWWPALAAAHLVAALAALRRWPVAPALEAVARRWPRVASVVSDWYPLLLLPALYRELALLNRALFDGVYFDGLVMRWEQALFGGHPSVALAGALPHLAVSEPLHAAYLSYYLIIYGPPLLLYRAGRRLDYHAMLFPLMLTFLVSYLFFIYFPVQGPRYLFPPPGGGLESGPMYRLAHRVLEIGSSQGAAFPSSHVAVAAMQTVLVGRLLPRLLPVVALLSAGLAVGAVYGGFHYATDVGAGFVLAGLLVVAAPRLEAALALGRSGARAGLKTPGVPLS
jgi:membrane-associated phospholipid phosphatase